MERTKENAIFAVVKNVQVPTGFKPMTFAFATESLISSWVQIPLQSECFRLSCRLFNLILYNCEDLNFLSTSETVTIQLLNVFISLQRM